MSEEYTQGYKAGYSLGIARGAMAAYKGATPGHLDALEGVATHLREVQERLAEGVTAVEKLFGGAGNVLMTLDIDPEMLRASMREGVLR